MVKRFFILSLLLTLVLRVAAQSVSSEADRPVIGISCSYPDNEFSSVRRTYVRSVLNAGGLPMLIPVMDDEAGLRAVLDRLDALILTGGEDVHPSYYGEEPLPELGKVNDERDVYDLLLIKLAAERNLPMLGICRGEQLINVAFGGTLYQDIPSQHADSTVCHDQQEPSRVVTHYVQLLPGSLVARITGQAELVTNTHHHQAVRRVAPGFRVSGWACDSIAEVIETIDGRPILGVQFHPEGQAITGDSVMIRFFDHLVQQAAGYRYKENQLERD